MKNLTKMILGGVSLVGLLGTSAGVAMAQDAAAAAPAPDWALTGYVQVTNDYKFRGISQNDRSPSPQGTLNLTGPDGFYVGTWASTVDFDPTRSSNPYLELDLYGGKHTDLWGVDWNIEPYYYAYPSEVYPGAPQSDYFELINQLTKTFGAFTTQVTYAWSPSFAFRTGEGNYLAGNLGYTITDWLSVSGNVGHQWVANARLPVNGSRDYTYGDIGFTGTYKGFALDIRYSGTDLSASQCAFYMTTRHACSGNVIATLTYNVSLLP
jgi:uncharacterized protein (TIGR02001 family)